MFTYSFLKIKFIPVIIHFLVLFSYLMSRNNTIYKNCNVKYKCYNFR
nr:MAG TPA: hypothetical protein [Caudoviricetes sp.]